VCTLRLFQGRPHSKWSTKPTPKNRCPKEKGSSSPSPGGSDF
jgi:hypothetical protein